MAKQDGPIGSINIRLVEQERIRMHKMIDSKYDELVCKALTDGHPERVPQGECLWSLAGVPGRFKGTKVTAVQFPDSRIVPVTTWKKAATEILKECNADPRMHERLMRLRDVPGGRFRGLFNSHTDKMDSPLEIDEGMYLEGKLDTEFLLKLVTKEIMDRIGYDYSRIGILIKDPKLEMEREPANAHTMQGIRL